MPGLLDDPCVVTLLDAEEQQVLMVITAVHQWQHLTNRDPVVPIHRLVCQLESQGMISRAHCPIWQCKVLMGTNRRSNRRLSWPE